VIEAPRSEAVAPVPAMAVPPGRVGNALYRSLQLSLGAAFRLWFRFRVENQPRLAGGYVLAANHASYLDPLLVGVASRRRVTFLMTELVWRSPVMGWFYRFSRTIPVAALGNNREALRAARSVLQQGRVVAIFPEGGLSRDGGLLLGSPGAVSLVLTEAVPIVPVGILGASRALPVGANLPRPHRITVRFGEPISPEELMALAPHDRKARLQAATTLIMARIAALIGQPTREDELRRA
jgi:1-acyl-sn-glycerol-3-phosphate acyltransferase